MSSYVQIASLFLLVITAAFFSSAEISLAAASKTRLQTLADEGDRRAAIALEFQSHPGQFFSALQVCVNAVTLLGGIVGDAAFLRFLNGASNGSCQSMT